MSWSDYINKKSDNQDINKTDIKIEVVNKCPVLSESEKLIIKREIKKQLFDVFKKYYKKD